MLTHKVKWLLLGLGLLALLFRGVLGGSSTALPWAAGRDAKDTKLKELLRERLATLQEVASRTKKAVSLDPNVSLGEVSEANQALLQAELELCETDNERVAVLEKRLAEAKGLEQLVEEWDKKGLVSPREALKPKAARLRVEIALERAKAK